MFVLSDPSFAELVVWRSIGTLGKSSACEDFGRSLSIASLCNQVGFVLILCSYKVFMAQILVWVYVHCHCGCWELYLRGYFRCS